MCIRVFLVSASSTSRCSHSAWACILLLQTSKATVHICEACMWTMPPVAVGGSFPGCLPACGGWSWPWYKGGCKLTGWGWDRGGGVSRDKARQMEQTVRHPPCIWTTPFQQLSAHLFLLIVALCFYLFTQLKDSLKSKLNFLPHFLLTDSPLFPLYCSLIWKGESLIQLQARRQKWEWGGVIYKVDRHSYHLLSWNPHVWKADTM